MSDNKSNATPSTTAPVGKGTDKTTPEAKAPVAEKSNGDKAKATVAPQTGDKAKATVAPQTGKH